jgi:CRP-like cAMP-binding protein
MARSTPDSHSLQQNHLLDALPAAEREQIYPHLQLVEMPLGKVVYEPGDLPRYAYFPTDCIVSLLYILEDGASAEISIVGNDGLIGVALCRRLLLSLDRLPANELTMTHELIANMLGVRREGVTVAVSKLQRLGVIDHSRGHITVLDRPAGFSAGAVTLHLRARSGRPRLGGAGRRASGYCAACCRAYSLRFIAK